MTDYALLVSWPDGRREQIDFGIGATIRLGTGLEGSPVGACDEHNQIIAHVIVCGNAQPSWLVGKRCAQTTFGSMHIVCDSTHGNPSTDKETLASWAEDDDKTSPDVETPGSLVQELHDELSELTEREHQPQPLISVLALVHTDQCSENDARRIHALADLITALQILTDLCAVMGTPSSWTVPGRMREHVDRARNCLQTILGNAEYLTETRADRVQLTFPTVKS